MDVITMFQCTSCGSFDISRIHRNLLERIFLKKIIICNECDCKWKIRK